MKRWKASSKMADVVHSGWMTKSPPERKVNAPFKIFRAHWKKRFFVLGKPSGSLPDQYELHYYKDEHCTKIKGSVDLEQCEQIIESLDSEHFPYLLAIKTIYKNRSRVYYLAVDTEAEMTSWVSCLCHVCGLKQEDNPTDIPEPKPAISQATPKPDPPLLSASHGSNGHAGNAHGHAGSGPLVTGGGHSVSTAMVVNTQPSGKEAAKGGKEVEGSPSPTYISLAKCVTGCPKRVDRSESTESMPDYNAPAAPPSYEETAHEDEVFAAGEGDVYHQPRKAEEENTYRVPPLKQHHRTPSAGLTAAETDDGNNSNLNSLYQVPPLRSKHEARHHSDRTDSVSSSNAPSENYDYPPSYKEADAGLVPPERPPRPGHTQSPYQNLIVTQPEGGASVNSADLNTILAPPPKRHVPGSNPAQGYDVPRASSHYVSPPPPVPHRPNTRGGGCGYMNAQSNNGEGRLDASASSDRKDDMLDGAGCLSVTPAVPPRSSSASDSQDGRSGSPSAIYHHPPPSSASSSSSSASGAPARPPARVGQRPQQPLSTSRNAEEKENGAQIFSTTRTRSFKKQHFIKPNNRAHTLPISVPVPAPRPVPGDYSSSDDADDEVTHHPLNLLRAVPPPSDSDRELKYIDLDLDQPEMAAAAASEAGRHGFGSHHHHGQPASHQASHSHQPHHHADQRAKEAAIEYREIDFVKTKALQDTKQVKDKERKIDDHN